VRELKIIDLFIDILIYPFDGLRAPFNIARLTQESPIVRICQLIYKFLKLSAKDNPLNKFYVAQWIPHFFDQVMITNENNDLSVQATIQELIFKNKKLLDNQINESTIEKIVVTCSDSKKDARFLSLLSSLCQCDGEACAENQDWASGLFLHTDEPEDDCEEDMVGDYDHLLIPVRELAGGQGVYEAYFDDPDLNLGGEPLRIAIDKI
jgi:hypothetical protein